MSKIIYEINLESFGLSKSPVVLNIAPLATTNRFRLIDCSRYIREKTLSVHEFSDFPVVSSYSAISYVWQGNAVDETTNIGPRFCVAGAEDGDPIGVDVLSHACTAALREGAEYVWLDRLCIIQTCKEDKRWQIERMFDIYKRCKLCLVLPGGIQRLVGLEEHTTWINRGWTLQETLAPPRVEVIYLWKLGSGMYYRDGGGRGDIVELVPGESAMTSISTLFSLHSSTKPANFFPSASASHTTFRTEIFGAPKSNTASSTVLEQTTEVAVFLLKDALVNINDKASFEERAPAIWRCALIRASSRPVDMVFSIMGLFGVTLDTHRFHKNDRLGATIALMQEILNSGRQASWLGVAPYLPANPYLSTFPVFPRTNVQGQVLFEPDSLETRKEREKHRRRAILDVRRLALPTGSMSNDGYLRIKRKAIQVYSQFDIKELDIDEGLDDSRLASGSSDHFNFRAINGTDWTGKVKEGQDNSPKAHAVLLGFYNEFSDQGIWMGPRHIEALLVKEHAPSKFHVESSFELSSRLEFWVEGWGEQELQIGGPRRWSKT
ncbi:hypothetical protein VKT23_007254 [Stygiomarasmius scandens]|uniref:Heterokaryon incompatibility domain-containing protein n=1 Tax=Marasmiellus scandens TaxID=2682957 RepID=A0ABR1JJW6_9AGAR